MPIDERVSRVHGYRVLWMPIDEQIDEHMSWIHGRCGWQLRTNELDALPIHGRMSWMRGRCADG
jgi:hypothetical protein